MAEHNHANILQYEITIPIRAPRARVWEALTEQTNEWWLPDFHMVGADSVVTLDAHAGGLLVERLAGGGSLLWYTVHMCTPERSLHLVGHMFPEWGGPGTSMLELALAEEDGVTHFRVRDSQFGKVCETSLDSLESGWRQLFTDGLAAFVERE